MTIPLAAAPGAAPPAADSPAPSSPVAPPLTGYTLGDLAALQGQLPAVYAIGRKVVRASPLADDHMFTAIHKMMSGTQVGRYSH